MKDTEANAIFFMAMRELLAKKSLNSITVQEIIHKSGYSRQCFYDHFTDKHDLVYKIFLSDMEEAWQNFSGSFESITLVLQSFLQIVAQNQQFYTNALMYNNKNSLIDKIYGVSVQWHSDLLLPLLRKRGYFEYTQFAMTIERSIKFYSKGAALVFREWVLEGMKIPPKTESEYIIACIPENMQQLLLEI